MAAVVALWIMFFAGFVLGRVTSGRKNKSTVVQVGNENETMIGIINNK